MTDNNNNSNNNNNINNNNNSYEKFTYESCLCSGCGLSEEGEINDKLGTHCERIFTATTVRITAATTSIPTTAIMLCIAKK